MVIFGLLDQNDTAQYIKINKAFLGEGDALLMAQQYDSINYGSELSVKIESVKYGAVTGSLTLQKDSSIAKEAGEFNSPKQTLYKTKDPLAVDQTYRLTATNTKTGYTATAETPLISGFYVKSPGLPLPGSTGSFDFANDYTRKVIQWVSGKNGRLYQPTIRFHYFEKNKFTNTEVQKYVDWVFAPQKSTGTDGGETMEVSFMGADFYQFIKGMLSPDANVWRYPGKLDFMFYVASEKFNTYMEVSAPSTGIVQEKPVYTNVENGIGIFSSRLRDYSRKGFVMNDNSLVKLYSGQYTNSLGFCDSIPGRTYSCQ